jgi:hypothetical protein
VKTMSRVASVVLLVLGVAGLACAVPVAPEIDPGTGLNALTLLAGAVLVFRAGVKK